MFLHPLCRPCAFFNHSLKLHPNPFFSGDFWSSVMEISKSQYVRLVLEMEACPHYGSLSQELKSRLYLLFVQNADKDSVRSALGLSVPASSASSSASSALPSMDYEKQTVAQLKELCAQRGLSTPTKAKKADYIEILKSAATPVAASDYVPSAAALHGPLDEPVVTSDISEPDRSHPDTTAALMPAPVYVPAATGALESSASVSDSADPNTAAALMSASHVPAASGADQLSIINASDVPAATGAFESSAPVSDSADPNTAAALMPASHVPAASGADQLSIINASDVPESPENHKRALSPSLFIATNKGHARKHYQIHFGQGIPNPIFDQVSSSTSTRLKSLSHTPPRKQIVSRIVLHV